MGAMMSTVGKNTAGNTLKGVINTTPILPTEYKFFIPAAQPLGSGIALDLSGKNNNALIDAGTSDAAVWANSGFMTTTAAVPGTGKGLTIQKVSGNSPLGWSLSAGQSLILSMQINFPTLPTGSLSRQFVGDVSSLGGVALVVGETSLAGGAGRLAVRVRDSAGVNNTYVPTSAAPLLIAGQTHTVVVYIDGVNKTTTLWLDGVASSFQNNQSLSSLSGNTLSNTAFNFGYYGDLSGTSGTTNVKFASVQALVFNKVPTNIQKIVQHLVINPKNPIEKWMLQ